jgi:ABC-type phosphate transport system substrate-binding protein
MFERAFLSCVAFRYWSCIIVAVPWCRRQCGTDVCENQVRQALACATSLPAAGEQIENEILGSGSTFPYPVLAKWAASCEKATAVHLNFQPVGSTSGVNELRKSCG